ncbi:MAG: hypothetical protein ABJA82_03590 [Myxococcales bacterium]
MQAPAAEQPSALAPQAAQVIPPTPQVSGPLARHRPPAQQPSGQEAASQPSAPSIRQLGEQPSPEAVLPSSQVSIPTRIMLSPQIAGAPRVRDTSARTLARMVTGCWSLATTVAPARPSTRSTTVLPATAPGSRMTAVSTPEVVSGRGSLGRVPGANAAVPPTVPEKASVVSSRCGS